MAAGSIFAIFGRFRPSEPIWGGAGGWTPTAQFNELAQTKPQRCARVPEAALACNQMSVGSVIYASPQTAWSAGRLRGDFRPLHPPKTTSRRHLSCVGGWTAAWVHHMTPREQAFGRGSPIRPLNMKKIDPREWALWARTCTRWDEKSRFFFTKMVLFFRIERISRAPRRVPRPPLPSEHGLKKSAS